MKTTSLTCLALSLLLLTPGLAHAASAPATAVPDVVNKGFDAYKKSSGDAVTAWLTGSLMGASTDAGMKIDGTLLNFEKTFGKYLGWELVKVATITPSTEIVYAVVKYEKGPLWIAFDCYKATDTWTIESIRLNQSAESILPPALLAGQ